MRYFEIIPTSKWSDFITSCDLILSRASILSLAPSSCHGIRTDLDLLECDEADLHLDLAVEVRLAWHLD